MKVVHIIFDRPPEEGEPHFQKAETHTGAVIDFNWRPRADGSWEIRIPKTMFDDF